MIGGYEHWAECQTCGCRLFQLSHEEYLQVAEKPYNIFYCYQCQKDLF